MVNSDRVRCSREFKILLREIKLDFIRKGRKPPSDAELTRRIALKTDKEVFLYEKFIPF